MTTEIAEIYLNVVIYNLFRFPIRSQIPSQIFEATATKTGINPAEAFISFIDAHVTNNHVMIWDLKYYIFENWNDPATKGRFWDD